MQNKVLLLFLLLLWISIQGFSQKTGIDSFVIVTFEKSINKYPQDGTKFFFWIMPIDSINYGRYSIFPLLQDGFSVNDFDSCCAGKSINPFVLTTETQYNFDSSYLSSTSTLKLLIKNNRIKVQEIKKQWSEDYVEKVEVFVTPIIGSFCYSKIRLSNKSINNYDGIVFVPKSSFLAFNAFLKSTQFRFVKFIDYSMTHFNITSSEKK